MRADIVNRFYFEFEPNEAIELYSILRDSKQEKNRYVQKIEIELYTWLFNQDLVDADGYINDVQ